MQACGAVWVCTPTAAHAAGVEAALAGGRAVFCEKPLATDLAAASAVTAAVVAVEGARAQSGLVLRSSPVFRALRALIASGELGPPIVAAFRDDQFFPVQGHYASTWRADVRQAGGGCLIEHSIHDLDILRYCLGEIVDVSARTANFAGNPGIEDLAGVSMRFISGAQAELVSVFDITSRPSTRRVEVFCRRGLVWLENDFRGPLHVQTPEGTEVRACPSPAWVDDLPLADDDIGLALRLYVEADRAFVDAVVAGRRPEPGLEVALVAHRLVEAAYRSARAGGVPQTTTAAG